MGTSRARDALAFGDQHSSWIAAIAEQITFTLLEEIDVPPEDIFGEDLKGTLNEFKELLASYRERKKKDKERQAEKDRREEEAEQMVAEMRANGQLSRKAQTPPEGGAV